MSICTKQFRHLGNPEAAEELYNQAEADAAKRMAVYKSVGELMK